MALFLIAGVGCASAEESRVRPALHWYRGNTHTHTRFSDRSDANTPPAEVARWFKDHGYQFVVITDHEHLTDVDPLNEALGEPGKFLILRGQEITQVIADPHHVGGVRHAHVNAINSNRLIMPVLPADEADLKGIMRIAATGVSMTDTYHRNLDEIDKAGGLPQINHPNLVWSVELKDLLPIRQPFLFEVWNGYPDSNNLGGFDDSGAHFPSAESLWDSLLSAGRVVWGVGSDDSHTYDQFDNPSAPSPGRAWVVACAPSLTTQTIVEALRGGHFYASTGVSLQAYHVDDKEISIEIARLADWSPNLMPSTLYTTRFIGQGGRLLTEVHGLKARFLFRGDETYVRASIIDSDGRRAWTQPIFRDKRNAGKRAQGAVLEECVSDPAP